MTHSLEDNHMMMLMDDTVLFGTSSAIIIKKFNTLMVFCESDGMVVNEKKTKLMAINGSSADRKEIVAGKITVKHVTSYIYLVLLQKMGI